MKETTDTSWIDLLLDSKLKQASEDVENKSESPSKEETEMPYHIEIKRIVFNDGAEQRTDFALLVNNDLVDVYEFNNGTKDTEKIIVAINKMIRFWQRADTIEIGASETNDFIVFKIEDCTGELYYRKHDIENALEVADCLSNLLPSLERIQDHQADAEYI